MEEIKPSLLEMLNGDDFFKKILVVESFSYIEPLRERFPTSEIYFVTAFGLSGRTAAI